ncbi:glycosyltransferase [Candidatus Gottesmanbacteria bacterium]|nr:glycosyltransferase [Candidatus Gottesmanbacteria bacterium]
MFLSVVIPSYNETENLKRGVLGEVRNYLSQQKYLWEVIISDDGSPDQQSKTLARDFCDRNQNFIFLENNHAGKPFAVWSGIKKAAGKIVLFTDMDQSTPISEIEKMLPLFEKNFDVVIGSRGVERKKFSLFRRLASMIFREFRRSLLLAEIIDTQAGFKAFRTEVAKEIFPLLQVIRSDKSASGWKVTSFDVELLVAAERRGYKIAEVSIFWEDRDVSQGKSRGTRKFIQESLDMLSEIFRVKLNDLRGFYNK